MMQTDSYEFYFLGEEEYCRFISNIKEGEQRNISFCGKLYEYNDNTSYGRIKYESKIIDVNFSRVSHTLQVKCNINDNSIYFIYGFIQMNKNTEDFSVICNFIRYLSNFNAKEYKALVLKRREILQNCKKLKRNNEFWYKE